MSLFCGQPDPAGLAAFYKRPRANACLLAFFDFVDEPVRICSRTVAVMDGQHGYRWRSGRGILIGLPNVSSEDDDDLAPLREYNLGILDRYADAENWRATVIDAVRDRANYAGRAYSLALQAMNDDGTAYQYPAILDQGQMSKMRFQQGPGEALLTLECEAGSTLLNKPFGYRYTDADQRALYPGDRGMEFTSEMNQFVIFTDFGG